MRPRNRRLLFAILACLPTGCGTVLNLAARPSPTPQYNLLGPESCEPFGGVRRSFVGGQFLFASPLLPVGVLALGVDVPLSLVADAVTLPLVNARKREEPWATWWGEQSKKSKDEPSEGSVFQAPAATLHAGDPDVGRGGGALLAGPK
jgi:uncharacterized protein YceK